MVLKAENIRCKNPVKKVNPQDPVNFIPKPFLYNPIPLFLFLNNYRYEFIYKKRCFARPCCLYFTNGILQYQENWQTNGVGVFKNGLLPAFLYTGWN